MKKKIVLGLAAAGTALAMLPLFAAFEAHVINVTATIENALNVDVTPISFGTVFPQEQLDKPVHILLSDSLQKENRVDDVSYIIRQKPKCAVTTNEGKTLVGPTATGEVVPDTSEQGYHIDCGPDPRQLDPTTGQPLPPGSTWGVLPSLCPYLSKHKSDGDKQIQESEINAFHQPFTIVNGVVQWLDAHGYLTKVDNDIEDDWNIDLKVPCFGGYCAQDWADYVHHWNATTDPSQYTQPIGNEHKVFGCDLWVETTGISPATPE